MDALAMALAQRTDQTLERLIYHSVRGVQYYCSDYVQMLPQASISISMTQNGSPYDNALAERVNAISKTDFFPRKMYLHHEEASLAIDKIIVTYNIKRPHTRIDFLTPEMALKKEGNIPKRWKKYKRKTKKEVYMNES